MGTLQLVLITVHHCPEGIVSDETQICRSWKEDCGEIAARRVPEGPEDIGYTSRNGAGEVLMRLQMECFFPERVA
jgi:hypothetical protein